MGAKQDWFEIIGPDTKKLADFYTKAFDWSIDLMPEMGYGMLKANPTDEMPIGGVASTEPSVGRNGIRLYCQVEDLQATLDKIVSLGGKVILPVTKVPKMVNYALYADPDGNINGIYTPLPHE